MPVQQRRPVERYDIDSLTDVALAVFAEKGYDGASMDDVARAAGITKASIYHHVPSKEALLHRGLWRALDALHGILAEEQAKQGRAVDRLRYIFKRLPEITMAMIPEASVLFRARGNSETERAALDRRRQFDRIVAELVREAISEGDVRSDIDPRIVTRLIFGMSNSLVDWFRPGHAMSSEQIADGLQRLAMNGILK